VLREIALRYFAILHTLVQFHPEALTHALREGSVLKTIRLSSVRLAESLILAAFSGAKHCGNPL
jgi:hypothetical protein